MTDASRADIGGGLYQLMRLIRRYLQDGIGSSLMITTPQSIVIAGLKYLGDGINQTDLSNHLFLHKAPLAAILDQLEQAGYVERRLDPKDRRVRRLYATPLANDIGPRIELVRDSLNASLTEGISDSDLRVIDRGISKMRDNLLAGLGESQVPGNLNVDLI